MDNCDSDVHTPPTHDPFSPFCSGASAEQLSATVRFSLVNPSHMQSLDFLARLLSKVIAGQITYQITPCTWLAPSKIINFIVRSQDLTYYFVSSFNLRCFVGYIFCKWVNRCLYYCTVPTSMNNRGPQFHLSCCLNKLAINLARSIDQPIIGLNLETTGQTSIGLPINYPLIRSSTSVSLATGLILLHKCLALLCWMQLMHWLRKGACHLPTIVGDQLAQRNYKSPFNLHITRKLSENIERCHSILGPKTSPKGNKWTNCLSRPVTVSRLRDFAVLYFHWMRWISSFAVCRSANCLN